MWRTQSLPTRAPNNEPFRWITSLPLTTIWVGDQNAICSPSARTLDNWGEQSPQVRPETLSSSSKVALWSKITELLQSSTASSQTLSYTTRNEPNSTWRVKWKWCNLFTLFPRFFYWGFRAGFQKLVAYQFPPAPIASQRFTTIILELEACETSPS